MRRLLLLPVLLTAILPAVPAFAMTCNCKAPAETEKTCLTIPDERLSEGQRVNYDTLCSRLPFVVGETLRGWDCDAKPLTDTQARPVPRDGICVKGPMDAYVAGTPSEPVGTNATEVSKRDPQAILPSLNTPIPGLTFVQGDADTESSSLLAQYIAAAYRYLITISATAATVMFVWGAFLYLIGSALPSIQRGKEIMQDAVVGLLLVLSTHFILRTINPATLELSALNVGRVDPSELGNYSIFAPIGDSDLPGDLEGVPNISRAQVAAGILQGSNMIPGVDTCVIMAICEHETGFRPIWSGAQTGAKKEKATSYGPCQIATEYLHEDNAMAKTLRKQFPDFPLVPQSQMASGGRLTVGEWFMKNPVGSGYAAALIFKGNVAQQSGNELTAIGGYGAGAASVKKWREANSDKCTLKPNLTVRNSLGVAVERDACIPHVVGVISKGEGKGCPKDKYVCGNIKQNARAEFEGKCSDGKTCYGMITDDFVNYVTRSYARITNTYPDCKR